MKKLLILTLVVGIGILVGCTDTATNTETARNTTPPAATTPAAATTPVPEQKPAAVPYPEVERISIEEAKKDFDAGNAVFIDTHSKASYDRERIQGAINVPVDTIEANLNKIPKGKKIIAYCS